MLKVFKSRSTRSINKGLYQYGAFRNLGNKWGGTLRILESPSPHLQWFLTFWFYTRSDVKVSVLHLFFLNVPLFLLLLPYRGCVIAGRQSRKIRNSEGQGWGVEHGYNGRQGRLCLFPTFSAVTLWQLDKTLAILRSQLRKTPFCFSQFCYNPPQFPRGVLSLKSYHT